jgi:hypothetical protein
MNISIDAATASPAALRLTAGILTFIANFKENPQSAGLPISMAQPSPAPTATPPLRGTSAAYAAADEIPGVKSRSSIVPTPPVDAKTSEVEPFFNSETLHAVKQIPTLPVDVAAPSAEFETLQMEGRVVDSSGATWDGEMHTANQSKNTDGTWRHKRTPKGEAPAAPRVAELPKTPQVPVPPPPPMILSVEQTAVPPAPSIPAPAAVVVPVPPAPSVSTDSSSPLTALGGDTFSALVKYVTNLIGSKKITTAQMLEACIECGVPDVHACSKPENAGLIGLVALAMARKLPQ